MTNTKTILPTEHCETCPAFTQLEQMGIKVGDFDRVIALAGNPNTGKSTLFNALTGLKQHTGNWPGKTVTRAEGGFEFNKMREGLTSVEVIGTVGESATGSAAASVTVNGVDAPLAADGSFRVTVPVHAGTNLISTTALSADGGRADDMRGVLTGTFRPATATVENAIAAQLSTPAFDVLGNTAETLIAQTDLNMLVMPYNPVIAKGLSNGQEDCLYGKVSVRQGLDLDHADIALVPGDAGLALDATLHQLYIPLHARYAAEIGRAHV